MSGIIAVTVRLIRASNRAYTRKWSFLGIFAVVFLGGVGMLGEYDLLPNAPALSMIASAPLGNSLIAASSSTEVLASELPTRIEIPSINLVATIANPTTTDTGVLDQALLKGAVRYPTSAKLGEAGNVVLFGHSSYLPIVGNQAYKTFDGIQKLVAGNVVTVYSSDTAYTYRVRSVAKESANDAGIPLAVPGRVLTLSTCDSFGEKTDRFVVTADFVDSYSVST